MAPKGITVRKVRASQGRITDNVRHIAHIVIEPECQRMGFGNRLVKDIMEHYQYDYITADVMYDNEKSKNFFKKLGFSFSPEDEKNRWNVKFCRGKEN